VAATMTFTSLKSDMAKYLERAGADDTTAVAQLPSLINLAERNISRRLKLQGLLSVATSTMVVGTSVYDKPARWRKTISINFGTSTNNDTRVHLYPRSYEYCRMFHPDPTVEIQPKFYADYDAEHWLFAGTPDATYPFEIVYNELPELLSGTNESNWLTDLAPEVLLPVALHELAKFVGDADNIGLWDAEANKSFAAINEEDLQKIVDRTSTRQEA